MTKEELIAILNKLPANSEVYVRQGDNAWPMIVRAYRYSDRVSAYMCIDMKNLDGHVNYPEGYGGVVQVPLDPKAE